MPEWLSYIFSNWPSWVAGVVGMVGIWGIAKTHYTERKRKTDEENKNEIKSVISEALEDKMKILYKASVSSIRQSMRGVLKECKTKREADNTDIVIWREMLETYKELGGNHYHEFVNSWDKEMEALHEKWQKKETADK